MNINLIKYGEGTPVVFFHGWGFDHQVWLSLVPQLSEYYQLILVDLPGFGLTPIMDWCIFKEQLLAQLPKPFALVGWSLGGLYAQRLAIEEPFYVSHLMAVTSSPCFIADESWPALSKEVFNHFYNNLTLNPEKTLKEFVYLQLNKTKVPIELTHVPSQEGLMGGLNILEHWDLRQALKNYSNPTCFVFGRLDPIVPVKIMEQMKTSYPQFHYVFLRSAHMPFLSHRELFIDELTRFIK